LLIASGKSRSQAALLLIEMNKSFLVLFFKKEHSFLPFFLLLSALAASRAAADAPEKILTASVYDRAARFLPENADRLVLNASVTPHWRAGPREFFTYRRTLGEGRSEFIEIDAATGARKRAFDQTIVAAGLSHATGQTVTADRLPFDDYDEAGAGLQFRIGDRQWSCALTKPLCTASAVHAENSSAIASPDGKFQVFTKDGNLWLGSADGAVFPLTRDGSLHNGYGVYPDWAIADIRASGQAIPTFAAWSPDSRTVFAPHVDERKVGDLTLVQSTPPGDAARPGTFSYKFPMPNEAAVPMAELWMYDIASRRATRVDIPAYPVSTNRMLDNQFIFQPGTSRAFLLVRNRYAKSITLYAIDRTTGHASPVLSETASSFLEPSSLLGTSMDIVLKSGDIVWYSERDGYGQLYLYDGTNGRLKRKLTDGDWPVQGIIRRDDENGVLYISAPDRAAGADPLYLKLYRLTLADGRLTLLTPEDAAHEVAYGDDASSFSPSGKYFVDCFSQPGQPPRSVLRRSDGRFIAEIERADISRLIRGGLTLPERFSALAADGKTRLFGNILRPSDFDPGKSYPVIDQLYPGPQSVRAYPTFMANVFDDSFAQTFAELGFIVVLLDGRGTPGRSKDFHDAQYAQMGQAGHLDDHVVVARELARRYPYMDLARQGLYGSSAGGFAALHGLLTYPDFYKAAVVDAGDHDIRATQDAWAELYDGPEKGRNYLDAENAPLAKQLKGSLMLMHGEMDTIVPPAITLRVVDALIKANKDFDLLIVPNAGHTTLTASNATPETYNYALRRAWDFLVRHLMNAVPPSGYDLSKNARAK
jgi:dipeptidyl aminopeptidase/acylaminoacyl peptidase